MHSFPQQTHGLSKATNWVAIHYERGKNANFVLSGNHSLRGACDGQNYL